MCGRYGLTKTLNDIKIRFGAQSDFNFEPNYNVCPTHIMPIIVDTPTGREVRPMRWGLLPFWAKDKKDGAKMINARSETVTEKPAYRDSFKQRRCIVPAGGFFEWKRPDLRPFWFYPREEAFFSFCGIWSSCKSAEGETVDTYSILTTSANEVVSDIHDRMPVAIGDNAIGPWLASATPLADLQQFLAPYAAEGMAAFEVSKYVNSVKNKGEQCVMPLNSE